MKRNDQLSAKLGYSFRNKDLLFRALSHRSIGKNNNERLEFIGDSLLNFIITDALFKKFPDAREGDLSRLRSNLVQGKTLSNIAKEFDIGEFLNLGEGELKSGGHRRSSILADAVEAIIGAVYQDSDFKTCRDMVLSWFESRLEIITLENTDKDPKTRLQEFLQKRQKNLPQYIVLDAKGEAHCREFIVECVLSDDTKTTSAAASSKRKAEQLAAKKMLGVLLEKSGDSADV